MVGHTTMTREKIERITAVFEAYGLPVTMPPGLEVSSFHRGLHENNHQYDHGPG